MKGMRIACILEGLPPHQGPCDPGSMRSLGYLHWQEEAERRYRKGDRQYWCLTCRCWMWPEECEHGKITGRERAAQISAIKKWVKKHYPSGEDPYRQEVAKARQAGLLPEERRQDSSNHSRGTDA